MNFIGRTFLYDFFDKFSDNLQFALSMMRVMADKMFSDELQRVQVYHVSNVTTIGFLQVVFYHQTRKLTVLK